MPEPIPAALSARVAAELSLNPVQVQRTMALFAEGATLPFIARYRKEVTGGLDEVQLRDVRERAEYITELEDRRAAILKSVAEQGKLDDALKALILAAETKQALEDLYLPFKPKRRTRAMIARERGLAPLAEAIWAGTLSDAAAVAKAAEFVLAGVDGKDSEVPSAEAALQGARDILAEQVAEDATIRGWLREVTRAKGVVSSKVIEDKRSDDSKYKDYYEFSEPLGTIPSHRMLAIRRGEAEGELLWRIVAPVEEIDARLTREVVAERKAVQQLTLVAVDAYKRLLAIAIEAELRLELKSRADDEAITIFGRNLEQLLLASPAGEKRVIGLDPGFRTGVKVAVVSATGALVHTDTLYLHQEDRFAGAIRTLVQRFTPELIAIGNGTASRETETLTKAALRELDAPRPTVVVVNEAGASVYSASDLARSEFPDLDVSLRGAVSIARRLQDP
ncbi:MAG TPA: Tex-like N-terminal domain-containing protein, partial [Gemmatimonadaceae bacterium]|nr:Tex-like N-terminal domain-containing protein [Gemmatimonadaceae bacterium]